MYVGDMNLYVGKQEMTGLSVRTLFILLFIHIKIIQYMVYKNIEDSKIYIKYIHLRLWCSTMGQVNQVSWHHLLLPCYPQAVMCTLYEECG